MKYFILAGLLITLVLSGCSQKNEATAQVTGVDNLEGSNMLSGDICNAYGAVCTDSCSSIVISGADCEKSLVCCK